MKYTSTARTLLLCLSLLYGLTSVGPAVASQDAGISKALADYHDEFPEVQFVHLQDVLDFDRLDEVYEFLGNGAENVDYEHPAAARNALMTAQRRRIQIMLEEQLPSATLFKAEDGSEGRPFVCVVTLDTALFAGTPGAATALLSEGLGLESKAKLDNAAFLAFTLDHEVFHCLDAYVNGPTRPRTDSFITESYNDYRAEQRADLYAALAHKIRHPADIHFLQTLSMYRTFAILDWDLEHYSAPVLKKALDLDPSFAAGLTLSGRLRFAMSLAQHWIPSASQYQAFAISAAQVAMKHNRAIVTSPFYQELSGSEYEEDPSMVAELDSGLRQAKHYVTTSGMSLLERP